MVRISHLLLFGAVASVAMVSCNRPPQANPEGTEYAMVVGTLDRLSSDITTLIGIDTITNMQSLRAEYGLRFPKRPPLFFAAPLKPVFPRDSEYQLPAREYYWLKEWNSNDSLETPLFWSFFHIPKDLVSYMTIAGAERFCSSNDFVVLIAPLSNRVERATLEMLTSPH